MCSPGLHALPHVDFRNLRLRGEHGCLRGEGILPMIYVGKRVLAHVNCTRGRACRSYAAGAVPPQVPPSKKQSFKELHSRLSALSVTWPARGTERAERGGSEKKLGICCSCFVSFVSFWRIAPRFVFSHASYRLPAVLLVSASFLWLAVSFFRAFSYRLPVAVLILFLFCSTTHGRAKQKQKQNGNGQPVRKRKKERNGKPQKES